MNNLKGKKKILIMLTQPNENPYRDVAAVKKGIKPQ